MSLKNIRKVGQSLAFRLALWYAAIFTLSSLAAFLLVYLVIGAIIQERTDDDLREDMAELAEVLHTQGLEALRAEIDQEVASDGTDAAFYRLLTPGGASILATDMSSWAGVEPDEQTLGKLNEETHGVLKTVTLAEHDYPARIIIGAIGAGQILQIGQSLEENEEFMEIFRDIFAVTLLILMIAATLIGWFMAKRALAGVEAVTRTAMEISGGALDKRVPVNARGDEVDRLAAAFNRMVDRIHGLIKEMGEMTDNIAHDLRNPITRIRGTAETTLTSAASSEDYEAMAANTIEECDRLLGQINTMLEIAEAEAGVGKMSMATVDMTTILRDACELFEPLSEDKDVILDSRIADGHRVRGDYQRLQRMVANLLDNAIKYTQPAGRVALSLDGDENKVVISVADTGQGIGEEELPYIFNRFFRCDQSRAEPGNGLGLSLARAIAAAHGGSIAVSSVPGEGSTFTVTLPATPSSHSHTE
ncbi:MAG: HAMP domain-containing sensor histidine kinase [bacterium]|nr:HAMP domain-containing sensor histidine kinase [bacterium]